MQVSVHEQDKVAHDSREDSLERYKLDLYTRSSSSGSSPIDDKSHLIDILAQLANRSN